MGAASPVTPALLPDGALLERYKLRSDCYTDCFSTIVPGAVALPGFISAFYKTPLFRVERFILKIAAKRPSTDADVARLAASETSRFAAWDVEDRVADQILLKDMVGRTRSWLMVRPTPDGTELFFGSAVTPPKEGEGLGFGFNALLGFHKLYSNALLSSARRALARQSA